MKTFRDEDGTEWDVVAGRESWGAIFAIFLPRDGRRDDIRQAPLHASGYDEAARELDALDEDGLRTLLGRSEPKPL